MKQSGFLARQKAERQELLNAGMRIAMSDKEQQIFVRGFFEIEDFADWLQQPAE